jgi:DnaK suppressor protein
MKKNDKKVTSTQMVNEDLKENLTVEFEMIRRSLLAQKSEILNRDSEFKKYQESTSRYSDEADQTVQELQNNVNIQLHERERMSLLLIEKTLSKFNDGTYGTCESCADSIGIQRLQARPLAALCIACMEDIENNKGQNKQLSAFFQ